jgi:hypothetical protein
LGFLDGLLDAEDEVRPASADIRTENVASIALPGMSAERAASGRIIAHFIVDTQRKLLGRVGHVCRVSEAVDRQAACSQSDHIFGLNARGFVYQ